jgi:hypothetical protein
MDFIGKILSSPDRPSMDKAQWEALTQEHGSLAPPEFFNPASREWEPQAGANRAFVKVSGCVAGEMKWAEDANEIRVFGDADAVGPIALEIAALLGGCYDRGALMSRSEYGRLIEPIWNSISIYDGPHAFLKQFGTVRPEVGHLFAAHWCQSEVCNGGFHQFFYNDTGVLAPEALAGFRAIGLHDWAEILNEAMRFFGKRYPRDRRKRQKQLDRVPRILLLPRVKQTEPRSSSSRGAADIGLPGYRQEPPS